MFRASVHLGASVRHGKTCRGTRNTALRSASSHPPPPRSVRASPAAPGGARGKSRSIARAGVPVRELASTSVHPLLQERDPTATVPGALELEDGTVFEGHSFGALRPTSGEVVFNTGMVGYAESLSDPSYQGQLLALTYPLVGNYGVPDPDAVDAEGLHRWLESHRIHASALLAQTYSRQHSHWNAKMALGAWLEREGVPALEGIDTRALTQHIRERGAMKARLLLDGTEAPAWDDPMSRNLMAEVSCTEPIVYGRGNPIKVLAVDCGIKYNIIRHLVKRGMEVTRVPWNHNIVADVDKFDGLFLSNGPGNPVMADVTVQQLRALMHSGYDKPIFGICMGSQLLGLAAGGSTFKLPFGNRGQNQPVREDVTGRGMCYITSQNHGYALDPTTLPSDWAPLFTNCNDGTNEGIRHVSKPWFSAQFHPEAAAGPTDTEFLFDAFKEAMVAPAGSPFVAGAVFPARKVAPPAPKVKKVLVLGSGGLSIGQAGEFDYSGSQAIKALKEEGIETVLINPNIASVQTNVKELTSMTEAQQKTAPEFPHSDGVYFLPVTPEYVTAVIEREKPDGIILSMGGQTALNCGVELHHRGVLRDMNVQVLGTQIDAVISTEDRDLFAKKLHEIGEKIAESEAVTSVSEAHRVADAVLGFPVMVRSAYALGGLGSGIAHNADELDAIASKALASNPQILVEKSLLGWKEVEYEVVRDADDNCVTVCNMENFDPLGVHTGDSVVVAPSQTLSDAEYHMLRETAIKTVRHLGIVGECNIQYAVSPNSMDYCIIEVNARLSRSSALASKATGYPLAFVATKLALGHSLPSLRNSVTKTTTACFEPALDYVVTKVPRWDLSKFSRVSTSIGSAMTSVGEVMGIGRSLEESLQKALRMVDPSIPGFEPHFGMEDDGISDDDLERMIRDPNDRRVYAIARALERGWTVDRIHNLSAIDHWFLHKLANIRSTGHDLRDASKVAALASFFQQPSTAAAEPAQPGVPALNPLTALAAMPAWLLSRAKRLGFSDMQIASRVNAGTGSAASTLASEPRGGVESDETYAGVDVDGAATGLDVRAARKAAGIVPAVKLIDTMAAEFPAKTNYLYTTYNGTSVHDTLSGAEREGEPPAVMVLGNGAYRIGSSVEFDWCAVSAIRTLRRLGRRSIMVNYNPETVSTDFDECDSLYFDELSLERILDVQDREATEGAIVSVGGQIPNNLALSLDAAGMPILGTTATSIDRAEDRNKFSAMLDAIGVDQPKWRALTASDEAVAFAKEVGFPVLVRPSYVLSGAAMAVAYTPQELSGMLRKATSVSPDHPVVVSKFHVGYREVEVDAVARDGIVIAHALSEHVEDAGVHSGDATNVMPPYTVDATAQESVKDIVARIAKELDISGPFNVQLLARGSDLKVIECNLRASRSFPFVSKVLGCDFIEAATHVMLGEPLANPARFPDLSSTAGPAGHFAVKAPMFSFQRLRGADPLLGVEMASTGEVGCFGRSVPEALLKALLSTNVKVPEKGVLVSLQRRFQGQFLPAAAALAKMGLTVYATEDTCNFLQRHGVPAVRLHWPTSPEQQPNIVDFLKSKEIDLVLNIPNNESVQIENNYIIRRTASDFGVPLFTDVKMASGLVEALARVQNIEVPTASDLPEGGPTVQPEGQRPPLHEIVRASTIAEHHEYLTHLE